MGDLWEGIKETFSNIGSSISNFFSSFSGGGGFFGGATSNPVHTAPPMVGNPIPPPGATPGFAPPVYGPQQSTGITRPQPATNIFGVGSAQGTGMELLGQGARRLAESIGGVGGRAFDTVSRGVLDASAAGMGQEAKIAAAQQREAAWRAHPSGAVSMAPPGQPMGPIPNPRGQFGAVAGGNLSDRLIQAKHEGTAAMIGRSMNQAQTEVAQHLVNKFLPQTSGPGGFFFGGRRR